MVSDVVLWHVAVVSAAEYDQYDAPSAMVEVLVKYIVVPSTQTEPVAEMMHAGDVRTAYHIA
jgi:hypothetical protein